MNRLKAAEPTTELGPRSPALKPFAKTSMLHKSITGIADPIAFKVKLTRVFLKTLVLFELSSSASGSLTVTTSVWEKDIKGNQPIFRHHFNF